MDISLYVKQFNNNTLIYSVMSQIHLSFVNTTTSGINMIVSWVKVGTTTEFSYNFIFPLIGFSIITTIASIAYCRRDQHAIFDCYVYNSAVVNFTSRDTVTCGMCCAYLILFTCCILSGIEINPILEKITYCNHEDDTCIIQFPTTVAMLSPIKTVYSAPMYNLSPQTKYNYRISESAKPIEFTTLNPMNPRIAFIGDFGYNNAVSYNALHNAMNEYDMVVHLGDIAYNLETNGDDFMKMIEPISSKIPYMTTPGNHEVANNFSYYNTLFNMPRMFYSFNIGTMHVISLSSELLFNPHLYSNFNVMKQFNWLERELRENINATTKIVYAHRPMYCSLSSNRCSKDTETMRKGMSYNANGRIAPLEQLLYNYGVQLYFAGHIHSYERSKPVYDNKVQNDGIVHILNGVGGCSETLDTTTSNRPSWLDYHNTTYGFGILNVDEKNMEWRQYATNKEGKTEIIDFV
jgi:hypothetical protein